ncbi:hypothetical protein TSUD_154550 [Trifolium subterraneum]|uniref:RNase H type-1 domain-containing protein n=1 Tax=Trifolium subterraneum TaxID=3900 RepID=A0A2Z6NV47_TRISU|nr:hypothetical protein TSUD_154550 [Trifolium subterraneum]
MRVENWCTSLTPKSHAFIVWNLHHSHIFKPPPLQATSGTAQSLIEDIRRAEDPLPHMERRYTSIQVSWSRSSQGLIKCNTDGALIPQNQSASRGGVFKDESGAWRGGFAGNIRICSALMYELWGILSALQIAKEKRLSRRKLPASIALRCRIGRYPSQADKPGC